MNKSELPPDKTSYKTTEGEVDRVMQLTGCSVFDALRILGASSWDEVEPYKNEVGFEDDQSSSEIPEEGISINLARRAIDLSGALNAYLKASRLNGLNRAIDIDRYAELQNRYNPKEFARIVANENPLRNRGDAEFFKAFGGPELVKAGYGVEDVKLASQEDADEFIDRFTGSANKANRTEFRKILKKQIKSQ